jgi:hypothetical protein
MTAREPASRMSSIRLSFARPFASNYLSTSEIMCLSRSYSITLKPTALFVSAPKCFLSATSVTLADRAVTPLGIVAAKRYYGEAMKSADSRPIAIPPEIAAKCAGPGQFERFDKLFRSVIAVPKTTIDKEEKKWKRKQARKRTNKAV